MEVEATVLLAVAVCQLQLAVSWLGGGLTVRQLVKYHVMTFSQWDKCHSSLFLWALKAVMAVYSSYKPFPSPSTTKHLHISHTILTEATPWKGRCWGHKEAWEAHRKLTDCQPHPHATSCSAHSMTLGRKRPTQSKAHSSTFLLNQTALPNCSQTEIYILTKTFEMLFIIYKLAQIYLLNLDTVNKIIRDSSTKTFHLSSSFQICMTF